LDGQSILMVERWTLEVDWLGSFVGQFRRNSFSTKMFDCWKTRDRRWKFSGCSKFEFPKFLTFDNFRANSVSFRCRWRVAVQLQN
jgi:hypothetical protein